jgi:hypothetical protein
MKEHAFIIYTDSYFSASTLALLNSIIEFNMHEYADVVLMYNKKHFDPSVFCFGDFKPVLKDTSDISARPQEVRFFYMHEIAKSYNSVCMLDADMFFLADVKPFFGVSKYGFPVGCNDDTAFDRDEIKNTEGEVFLKDMITHRVLCTVPFFFSYDSTIELWKDFLDLFHISDNSICDYDIFNYALIRNPKISEKMVILPSHSFTGVHFSYLKKQSMFAFDIAPIEDLSHKYPPVITDSNMRVYSFHGKYFEPYWINEWRGYMKPYFQNEYQTSPEKYDCLMQRCEEITNNIFKRFLEYLFDGYIPFARILNQIPEKQKEYILKSRDDYQRRV